MIVHIDGGSRGNPGPAGYGLYIEHPTGVVTEVCKSIGTATNNVAEYNALIGALEWALEHKATDVLIKSDSMLLVNQMKGRYAVKSSGLIALWQRAQRLAQQIGAVAYIHVPREENRNADRLANRAMDEARVRERA